MTATPDLDLRDDGDTAPLSPSLRIRLALEHDPDASLNDYDGDGHVSDAYPYRAGDGHRPPTFTDRAIQIPVSRSEFVWWEPYDDLYGYPSPTPEDPDHYAAALWTDLPPEERERQLDRITAILNDGYLIASLILEEQLLDSLGAEHWIPIATSSCGAIEPPLYPELIADLLSELPISDVYRVSVEP